MLTIGKLGAGQADYYLEKVADGAEDYYSGEGEATGRWRGDGARELGLSGEVEPEALRAMLTGADPAGGEPLVATNGVTRRQGPVPGFDLTFSAPKSVSLLWALGEEQTSAAVRDAHERSIDAALAYLEREACWARRGRGGAQFVQGSGYLAAAYRHRTSRAGDPQLHTHVLVANATKGPDGRWTRLHHPSIYDHAKTAGYLYEAQLRHELTRGLGVEWQEVHNGIAELQYFEDHQLREFSTRRAEILAAAGGPNASRAARQAATLATRKAKNLALDQSSLRERWAERARAVELDVEIPVLLGHDRNPGKTRLTLEEMDHAVTQNASHFDRRGAVQALCQSLPHGGEAVEIERSADAYLTTEHVVRIGEGPKGERFTTARIWALEREALRAAQRLQASEPRVAGEPYAREVLSEHSNLTTDQRRMIQRLLAEPGGLAVVIGEAGTGKSHAIAACAEGWERAGIPLRAVAPTWQAANVLRAEGIEATSIARLLVEFDDSAARGLRGLDRDSVLLVDEAAMVDSGTLARLVHHAEVAEARLVLVGDPGQLPEIAAGGLFSFIAVRSDPIHLREQVRQERALDRETLRLVREGRGTEALELYRAGERVTVARDPDAKRAAMVADWWGSFSVGEDAVMLCRRNVEASELNSMARALMREEGRLGEVELDVGGWPFAVGDRVVTRVNSPAHEVTNRERWRVIEVDPDSGRVVVEGVDHDRAAVLDADYLARTTERGGPSLEHAYASNLYLAQGRTVDTTFVAAEPAMGREDFYVAMSRAREETRLYTVAEPQFGREEYAPREAWERELLGDVREAIERPTAQLGAVDEATRAEIRREPTRELVELREFLRGEIGRAEFAQRQERMALQELERAREHLAETEARVDALAHAPRRERRELLPIWERAEEGERKRVAELEVQFEQRGPAPEPSAETRAELAAVDRELAERRSMQITADRLSPPDYITRELGKLPQEPELRARWERGVYEIERYRQEHGVRDPALALGREPGHGLERADHERTRDRLQEVRRDLRLEHTLELTQELRLEHTLELGR
jgi:conjugative relaxase-like TrwC/TraI family protein